MLVPCEPNNPCPPPQMGACCNLETGVCVVLTEAQCAQQTYPHQWLAGAVCEPNNPCPPPPPHPGACCNLDTGACTVLTEAECNQQTYPHQWLGPDTNCNPNLCPPPPLTGACCFLDGTCQMLTRVQCTAAGGSYLGDGIQCTPTNPCPSTPTEKTTWGRIKSHYR